MSALGFRTDVIGNRLSPITGY